jgi:hypothetical protein
MFGFIAELSMSEVLNITRDEKHVSDVQKWLNGRQLTFSHCDYSTWLNPIPQLLTLSFPESCENVSMKETPATYLSMTILSMCTFAPTNSSLDNALHGTYSEKNCPSKLLLESSKFNRKMFGMPWQRVMQSRKGAESIPHLKTTPRNASLNGLVKMPRTMLL